MKKVYRLSLCVTAALLLTVPFGSPCMQAESAGGTIGPRATLPSTWCRSAEPQIGDTWSIQGSWSPTTYCGGSNDDCDI